MSTDEIWIVIFVLSAAVAATLVLRFVSIFRPGLALAQAPQWRAVIAGDTYMVSVFSTDAWTISIALPSGCKSCFVASMRLMSPKPTENRIAQHLSKLDQLGVDLVDFGAHADWIAAEVPFLRAAASSDNAINIARELINLRSTIVAIKPTSDAPRLKDQSPVLSLFHRIFRHHLNQH